MPRRKKEGVFNDATEELAKIIEEHDAAAPKESYARVRHTAAEEAAILSHKSRSVINAEQVMADEAFKNMIPEETAKYEAKLEAEAKERREKRKVQAAATAEAAAKAKAEAKAKARAAHVSTGAASDVRVEFNRPRSA